MSDVLNQMIWKIEHQLASNGLNPMKSINNKYTKSYEKRKQLSDDQLSSLKETNNNKSWLSFQMTNSSSLNSIFASRNNETHKMIVRELEPFISSVRSELNNTIETFKRDSKNLTKNQLNFEAYKEKISLNNEALAKLEDTKEEIAQLSNKTKDLNCNYLIIRDKYSEANQKLAEMSSDVKCIKEEMKLLQINEMKSKSNKQFELTEIKVEEMINSKIDEIVKNIDMKLNQIIQSTNNTKNQINILEQSIDEVNKSLLKNSKDIEKLNNTIITNETGMLDQKNEIAIVTSEIHTLKEKHSFNENNEMSDKKYIDNQIFRFKSTFSQQINEMEKSLTKIIANCKPQNPQEVHNQYALLTNQYTNVINKISSIEAQQLTYQNKLNEIHEINTNIILNQQSNITQTSNQFSKVKEEIALLTSTLEKYKSEQSKLNLLHETIFKCISNQLFSLNEDTASLIQNEDNTDNNLERIQENFGRIQPLFIQSDKLKNDLNKMAEIVSSLPTNTQKLQNEINDNFALLTTWQSEMEYNITKKVNVIKKEYENEMKQYFNKKMTKEFNTMFDQLELLSNTKFAAKIDLEILKTQISEIEIKIKGDKERPENSRKSSRTSNSIKNKKKEESNFKRLNSKSDKTNKKKTFNDTQDCDVNL